MLNNSPLPRNNPKQQDQGSPPLSAGKLPPEGGKFVLHYVTTSIHTRTELQPWVRDSLVPSLSAPVFTSIAVRKTEGEPGRFDHATPWHRDVRSKESLFRESHPV